MDAVVVSRRGRPVPAVALFASRTVQAGAELAYRYAEALPGAASRRPCGCGASCCTGFMPGGL
jgi:hypothetical protein